MPLLLSRTPVGGDPGFLNWDNMGRSTYEPAPAGRDLRTGQTPLEALMSTTPDNDEDRTHNESPAEGEQAAPPDAGREHSQNAAEGEEDQA